MDASEYDALLRLYDAWRAGRLLAIFFNAAATIYLDERYCNKSSGNRKGFNPLILPGTNLSPNLNA